MNQLLNRFDTSLTQFVATWPSQLHAFFIIVTTLGSPVVTAGIGLFVIIWGYTTFNVRLALSGFTVWVTLFIGSIIKISIGRQRPLTDYVDSMNIHTFSFPSGHTSGATIAYGLLAYALWHTLPRPWDVVATGVLVLLIVAIGISRVYLGAHFPSDVIAGWLLGLLALTTVIFILKPFI